MQRAGTVVYSEDICLAGNSDSIPAHSLVDSVGLEDCEYLEFLLRYGTQWRDTLARWQNNTKRCWTYEEPNRNETTEREDVAAISRAIDRITGNKQARPTQQSAVISSALLHVAPPICCFQTDL